MRTRSAAWGSLVAGAVVLVGAISAGASKDSPASAPSGEATPCVDLGTNREPEALKALFAKYGRLVISGEKVLSCPCAVRHLGGETEARHLGGETETRHLGGETEARHLGGETEARHLGGETESRHLGGETEARHLGGETEARHLGGETEARHLGGETESRHLGGETEARHLGGETESRHLGGETESRHLGGETEARHLGGEVETLTCSEVPTCTGFVVSGSGTLATFDAQGLHPISGRCVP